MNVVRKSGAAFDADRLFATGDRTSLGGFQTHIVDAEGMNELK